MNPQSFINEYTGTYVDYDGVTTDAGQCVQLVELWAAEGLNTPLPVYPTALVYWTNDCPGYIKVSTPQPGDIVCYNAHTGDSAGHIAIYVGNGQVFEQNADPDGSPAHLFARANTYLLGYLRKENTMYPNQGDLVNVYNDTGWPGHSPNSNDLAYWTEGTGNPNWGNADAVWKAWMYEVSTYVQTHPATVKSTVLTPGTYEVQ